ncbi:hypothetical protein IIO_04901 [Bacillus cereus VD115]|nr:hypothetical protein IIO_04901 [Bacillus cereus VD115]
MASHLFTYLSSIFGIFIVSINKFGAKISYQPLSYINQSYLKRESFIYFPTSYLGLLFQIYNLFIYIKGYLWFLSNRLIWRGLGDGKIYS